MRLRLFHAADGARIAYRETGTGPPLVLVHSAAFSHREFEPLVEHLAHRFRLVLPDLPLHGDSEDRPRHPYTGEWLADILAAFCVEVGGPRPLVGGHGLGADLLLTAAATGRLRPRKLVLMPNPMHRPPAGSRWLVPARAGAIPGVDLAIGHVARLVRRPERAIELTATHNEAAIDLVRHAMSGVGGNANLARSWARFARESHRWAGRELLDRYESIQAPTLLLWADQDPDHPLSLAEEALDLLPNAQLRVLGGTGYLIAYDDPVGVAREIVAFCG